MSEREMGTRANEGKLRFDLIPASADAALAKVLTFGARKYSDRNWEKGMPWCKGMLASIKRHLHEFEKGNDYDAESGLSHLEHALTDIAMLNHYQATHPEYDDRPHRTLPPIGLDIDDVLADFVAAYKKRFNITHEVTSWHFDENMAENMAILEKEPEFWLNLEPKVHPDNIPFEPHCYVTARSIPTEVTVAWLKKHGFPIRPVHSVGYGQSKAHTVRSTGCVWFIDDAHHNYLEINKLGVCCYLLTTAQNARYEVGHRRIANLWSLPALQQ